MGMEYSRKRINQCKQRLKKEILQKINLSKEISDNQVYDVLDEVITEAGRKEYLSLEEKQIIRKEVFNSLRRLDVLQELLEDEEITEIMINGPNHIFIEKKGHLYPWEKCFESKERLEDIIQQIVSKANRSVNEANPIVDARLEDGSRIHVVLAPVAINGPILTIRKFPSKPIKMEDLIRYGSITQEAAEVLKKLVVSCYNIFISGGTGSGKTTFLNVLSNYIPKEERVITIEDSAELNLSTIDNLVSLEVRNANVEGKNEIQIGSLIKAAMRMRPNRIIIGEIRDGIAAWNLIHAMSSGHDGSISTGHANSSKDMLMRLSLLILSYQEMPLIAIGKQIASAIDIIVHLGRIRDKTRKVLEIDEVVGWENGEFIKNTLFRYEEDGEQDGVVLGSLRATGNTLLNIEKLNKSGISL